MSTPADPSTRPQTPTTPGPSQARIEERLRWLDRTQDELARSSRNAPWLALTVLVALPVGLLWGAWAAAAVALVAIALPVVAGYILWCHRQEYALEHETLRGNLLAAGDAERPPTSRSLPWRVPSKPSHL